MKSFENQTSSSNPETGELANKLHYLSPMQIVKPQKVHAMEVENQPQDPLAGALPESENGGELEQSLEGFFAADETSEPSQPELKPFDALFAGKETPISKSKYPPVPNLDELLMEEPKLRFKLDLVQTRYEKARSATFKQMERVKGVLQTGSLTPGQRIAIQEDIRTLQARLGEIDHEIESLKKRVQDNDSVYFQEISDMKDLNGDGYIGDPNDPDNSLILAKHPNGQIVPLDPKTMKPAEQLLINPDKKAEIFSTDHLDRLDKADAAPLGEGQIEFDEAFRIKASSLRGELETTFGALIDISVPESLLVEKGADGKPKLVADGFGRKKYSVKPLSTQEGTFGQESLKTAGQKDYMAIKVAKVQVYSDGVGFKDAAGNKIDGSHVYVEFKDRTGRVILRIRVEGVETPNKIATSSPVLSNRDFYTAATTVGVALNAGKGENNKRISPVEIDTTGYQSTGRLKVDAHSFYEQLGLSTSFGDNSGLPSFKDATGMLDGAEKTRKENAANETLFAGFLLKMFDINGEENGVYNSYLAPRSNSLFDELGRFGVAVVGLRGNMTLGNDNNIVVQPPPNSEEYLASLPPWMEEIHPEDPSYRTTIDAGAGRNILISNGGDIFAKGITFFERNAQQGESGSQIWVELNNSQHNNHATYVNVNDPNPEMVNIVNGDDTDPKEAARDASKVEGNEDDWFNDHAKLRVSDMQNDLPGGLKLGSDIQVEGLPQAFDEAFGTEYKRIQDELIEKDPLTIGNINWAEMEGEWEFGDGYHQEGEKLESFFDEYSFFKSQQDDGDLNV